MWQANCMQDLQQQAASTSKAQHAAEADLARVKSKGADIQRKVLAAQQYLMIDSMNNMSHPVCGQGRDA